jgi:hypothetical protein
MYCCCCCTKFIPLYIYVLRVVSVSLVSFILFGSSIFFKDFLCLFLDKFFFFSSLWVSDFVVKHFGFFKCSLGWWIQKGIAIDVKQDVESIQFESESYDGTVKGGLTTLFPFDIPWDNFTNGFHDLEECNL